MKKLNNKGVTLVELIVSFVIVAVAIIYFYQTLYTVNKLYITAQNKTNDFVYKDYALRIADASLSKDPNSLKTGENNYFNYTTSKYSNTKCTGNSVINTYLYKNQNGEIKKYDIVICF